MVQQALTVIAPIKSGEVEALKHILNKGGREIGGSASLYFQRSPSTHFARFVILADPDQAVDPNLLFTSNHDGDFNAYMQELVETMGSEMAEVWRKCEGYSIGTALDTNRFTEFIRKHALKSQAFYIAYRGESVQSVLSAIKIRERIDEILDFQGASDKLKEVYELLPDRLKSITHSSFATEKKIYQDNSTQAGSSWILDLLERNIGVKYEDNDPSDRLPFNSDQQVRNEESKQVEDAIVQKQWLNNARFWGTYNDKDPLIGINPSEQSCRQMTIPQSPVLQKLANLPNFVSIKGGAYFFLPSKSALYFLAGEKKSA